MEVFILLWVYNTIGCLVFLDNKQSFVFLLWITLSFVDFEKLVIFVLKLLFSNSM